MRTKKGWLPLSSAAVAIYAGSCMIITIILITGINPLFPSSPLQIHGTMDENMNTSKTSINNTGQYTNANNTQDWEDPENNL